MGEVLGSYLNDIRHFLQESSELFAVGSLRVLDPSHSEERSNSEVSHSDPPVPSKHSRLLRSSLCRSEEHTSELQSREKLVCRLLLEKEKNKKPACRSDG